MKYKRRSLILFGSIFLITAVLFSPGRWARPVVLADSGAGQTQYLPFMFYPPSPTPTLTPTPTFTPTPNKDLPLPSTSYYVKSMDIAAAYDLGCQLGARDLKKPGKQQSVVVLAFAYPQEKNGVFGAYTYVTGVDFASVDQIAEVVEWFGYGYWFCVDGDFESHLYIGVGTANHPAPKYNSVTYEHGQAWSQMVAKLDNWFANDWFKDGSGCYRGCDGQINAWGANDLELAWNSPANSSNWVKGYASVDDFRPLVNFGALDGCPTLANPGAQCGNYATYLWSRDQVLEVTAYSYIRSLPEIYLTDGRHAQQWYLMSKYAANSSKFGQPMRFLGPLTEYQACLQRGGCSFSGIGINNSPQQAWDQFFPLIYNDSQTRVNLAFASDIKWQGEKDVSFPYSSQPIAAGTPSAVMRGSSTHTSTKALPVPVPANAAAPDLLNLPPQMVESSKAIVHASEGIIRNAWEGPFGGQYLYVLAGASPEDAHQGLVIIDTLDPATGATSRAHFLPPLGTGSLRILAVADSRVSLATASGGALTFDLETKQFK